VVVVGDDKVLAALWGGRGRVGLLLLSIKWSRSKLPLLAEVVVLMQW